MTTATRFTPRLCAAALLLSSPAAAEIVVTQVEERAFFSLWLLSDHPQQSVAHDFVQANHDVIVVPVFDADALAGADLVYLSPSLDELQLQPAEIDALVEYVTAGGRLVIPADNSVWADEFRDLAARFDVTYGQNFVNGVIPADVLDTANPIINGPGGKVGVFDGASHNDELSSSNPDFRVIAQWQSGPNSIGYLPHGNGEVVFLTDFNTFDNDMIHGNDNFTLWANLFDRPEANTADLTGFEVTTGAVLGGGLDELRASDDAHLRTRSGFGQTFVDLHNMTMRISAVTAVDSATSIDVTIEARIDEPSGSARASLRNWTTGEFDVIGAYPIDDADQIQTFEGLDASQYVDSSGGAIELRTRHVVFVPFFAFTFESFIDHIEITVE